MNELEVMMTVSQIFDHAVNASLVERLKHAGFKKQRNRWARRANRFLNVVDIQRSQYNTNQEVRFFINVGLHPDGFENAPTSKYPAPYECWTNFRCDVLVKSAPSVFEIRPNTSAKALTSLLASIVAELIETLDQIDTVQQMIDEAFYNTPIESARTYYALGQDQLALQALQSFADSNSRVEGYTVHELIEKFKFHRIKR